MGEADEEEFEVQRARLRTASLIKEVASATGMQGPGSHVPAIKVRAALEHGLRLRLRVVVGFFRAPPRPDLRAQARVVQLRGGEPTAKDPRVEGLAQDLEGEVLKACTRPDHFQKWGQH